MASGFFGYLIGLCSFWCVNRMRTESESKVSSRTSPQTTFSPWHHANLKRTQKQTAPTPTASHVRTTSDALCQVRPANIADYVQHRRHRQQASRSRSPTKRRIEIPLDDGIHSMEFTNTPAPAPQHSHDEFDHLVIIIVAFVACLALAVKAKAWLATV